MSGKVGKPRILKSPEQMEELFQKYKEWAKANPIKKHVFVGKDGNSDYQIIDRPLSITGFEVFCHGEIGEIAPYLMNRDNRFPEFSTVSARIKREIAEQQIAGGMAGIYNASLTARLNNLVEKVAQTDSKGEDIPLLEQYIRAAKGVKLKSEIEN